MLFDLHWRHFYNQHLAEKITVSTPSTLFRREYAHRRWHDWKTGATPPAIQSWALYMALAAFESSANYSRASLDLQRRWTPAPVASCSRLRTQCCSLRETVKSVQPPIKYAQVPSWSGRTHPSQAVGLYHARIQQPYQSVMVAPWVAWWRWDGERRSAYKRDAE